MHDFDLEPDWCPWAVSCFDLGGKKAGRWVAPCIGDWVWITFERQHPYGPIWTGFADPTRRRFYAYPQVFGITPLSVNEEGKKDLRPKDYDTKYLPKDGRPMSHGWADRYGNLELHSAVGFYPAEHQDPPPPSDHDAVSGSGFKQKRKEPLVNDPDKKYMARVTKYGHIFIMGDQGYHWKKDESQDIGEFHGDAKKDEKFETKRWLFLQRLLNDNKPRASMNGGDQRKQLMMTRYGHRIEMRDVGWAQQGPIASQSRQGEFGPATTLSQESNVDHRWIKIRTKGGMLFQAYDKGFNPDKDIFIKRKLLEESGAKSELEDKYWKDRDARWMRMVTRYGYKFVLDDRGSNETDARRRELPRGMGILIKGRRSPSAKNLPRRGNSRGFHWEINERDDANHTTWCTPLGQAVELNDRYQYVIMTSSLGKKWVSKWRHVKDNEFLKKPVMIRDPEMTTHHMKIDHDNEYIRFKTRANNGSKPIKPANPSMVGAGEINQGVEARDGRKGDGAWVEIVDCQHRGMWFSKKYNIGIWRARKKRKMYQWMDESARKIVIFNDESNGRIQIFANGEVSLTSNRDINIRADRNILMRAGNNIFMQAGGSKFSILPSGRISSNTVIFTRGVITPVNGGTAVSRKASPDPPPKLEPSDRGKTYNKPYEASEDVE